MAHGSLSLSGNTPVWVREAKAMRAGSIGREKVCPKMEIRIREGTRGAFSRPIHGNPTALGCQSRSERDLASRTLKPFLLRQFLQPATRVSKVHYSYMAKLFWKYGPEKS
jgi:hypothetical protein